MVAEIDLAGIQAAAASLVGIAERLRYTKVMRTLKTVWGVGVVLVAGSVSIFGQMHKVTKPETVVRAVGVYEWTGDVAKPAASRLIPVTLYIDKHLEDAGIYLARPVPFALETGNVYELEEAGVQKGTLDLVYARHLQATKITEDYDDGWFGYGTYQGLAAPKKPVIRKQTPARTSGIETASTSGNADKPHFSNKAGQPVAPGSTKPDAGSTKPDAGSAQTDASKKDDTAGADADPDRPHLSKKADAPATGDEAKTDATDKTDKPVKTDSGRDSAAGSGTAPAGDPDRPTMKRRSGNDTADTSTTAPATATSGGGAEAPAADDPDRPTLKRHSVEDAKKKAKAEEQASVTGTGSLNVDPDRPNLHRGKPVHAMTEADLPKLAGLPVNLRQMVAVSDAATRPAHDFARAWEDDAERAAVLAKMQAMAQAQLAMYGAPAAAGVAQTGAPSAAKAAGAAAGPGAARAANRSGSKLRRPPQPLRVAMVPLLEEQMKGYLLSYGDVPTFVYQAHTAGDGASLRYVTIVAQRDAQGEPKMVLHAVTDATHLDRTARMRLVDAVDVDASNRASLLFEMQGQTSRQFGVYRVLGLQAEQIFSTGTSQ